MTTLFCTPEEIATITGYIQRSKQLAWLKANHWKHETNARGGIVIARGYAEKRMGVGQYVEPSQPEWGNLRTFKPVA
jgi:Domain of unknown function (DUF4224)